MHILIAEDNLDNRELLARRIARQGWEVSLASDGIEAIEMCRKVNPDLVLMDLSMPRMTGLEAVRALRADPATNRVKIIAVTAHAMDSSRMECIEAGCNDFETKPINFAELFAKIHEQLGIIKPGEAA
jgi:two-component system cell cycle response regulator DivK